MSKPVKWTLIFLSVPVALFLLLAIAVKLIITEDLIISKAAPVLEQQLHRKVTIGGAGVEVFPSLAVVIRNVSVADDPAFSDQPFLAFTEFRLGVRWLPLLTRSVEISEAGIDGLSVSVIKNPDGKFNFDSMIPAADSSAASPDSTAGSGELPVQSIALNDIFLTGFNLTFEDFRDRSSVSVKDLNYHLSVGYTTDSLDLAQSLEIGGISYSSPLGELLKNLPVSLNQNLSLSIAEGNLKLRETDLKVGNLAVSLTGSVLHLKDSVRTLDLALSSGETDLKQFLSLVPADIVKDITKIETKGTFSFSATAKGNLGGGAIPAVSYSFSLADGSVQYAGFPAALSGLTVDVTGTENSVDLKTLSASVKNSSFSVQARVTDFKNPEVGMNAKANLVLDDVKSFYPLGDSMSVGGSISADIAISGPALTPGKLKGSGLVTFSDLNFSKKGTLPGGIQSINGSFEINNDRAELKKLKISIGTSDLELNGKVENYLGFILNPDSSRLVPSFTASLSSQNFNAADVLDMSAQPQPEKEQPDTVKLKVPQLPRVEGRFLATIGKFTFTDIVATGITAQADIRDQVITLSNTRAGIVGGTVKLDGKVSLDPVKGVLFDLNTDVSKLQAADMFRMFPSIEKMVNMAAYLKGDVSVNAVFRGTLSDSLTLVTQTLYGLGSVALGAGSLSGHPIQNGLATYLGATDWQTLSVSGWTAGMEIKEGKLYLDNLKASAGETEISGDGWQALDQTIGYELTLALPKSLTGKLESTTYGKVASAYMTDKQGRVITDLNVGGTFTSPTIKPDPSRSAGRAKDAVVNQVKQEVSQKAEEVKSEVQSKVNEEAEKLKAEAEKKKKEAEQKAVEEAKKKLKIKWPL
ncbi:MAG: AsmA family protein [Bacteroidetes bacterium]|nr:AsmA family protein [Bacteroidota bacterium]